MAIVAKRYETSDSQDWDQFVKKSKIDTILFRRSFMDYHKDRFKDYSLICVDEQSSKIVGLFPANVVNDKHIVSHQGLTFGGLICEDLKTAKLFSIISEIVRYYKDEGLKSIKVTVPPNFVNPKQNAMCKYALYQHQFQLSYRDLTSVIDLRSPVTLNSNKKRNIKKAKSNNISIDNNVPISEAYEIIFASLNERYSTVPTHSFGEISKLLAANAESISIFGARTNDESLCAVCIVFESESSVHTQYLAASKEGLSIGALDLLTFNLATNIFSHHSYMSLGTSSEEGKINAGLMLSKEGLGATCHEIDTYLLQLR